MHLHVLTVFLVLLSLAGCATASSQAVSRLQERTGVPERTDAGAGTAIPPGVTLDDGITPDEAVAVALWNNADFRVQLAQLGFARADLLEAGLLRNPVLSLLFPWGPKQLEATLRWPIEALWERPRRVAAATLAVERVATGLEQNGLDLVSTVKISYADLALARDRAQLAEAAATELDQIRELTDSRLQAGDISELEARSAAIDAARARQEAARARLDVTLRANDLRGRLGLGLEAMDVTLPPGPVPAVACPSTPDLLNDALASRPDVRAAEIGIEEAGRRLGWERSRILAVSAVVDANGEGTDGFESGPGVDISAPIFDRNQGGRGRAAAELQRATYAYAAARQRVATELRDAITLREQAETSLAALRDTVLQPLEMQVAAAERAFAEGEVSYLFVLEMSRRRTDARLRAREAEADLSRAIARTERAVGRTCSRGSGFGIGDTTLEGARGF
jgi:cobalt-zinc-cadmium efflux system outer membrane protein